MGLQTEIRAGKTRNIVSVRLLDDIGIDFTIKQLKDFGFDTKLPKDLTLSIGSGAIEPIKLAVLILILQMAVMI